MDLDTVRFPDGHVGTLEMVRHPGASAVVPLLTDLTNPEPQILLIRQYRYAADGVLYEIPAGRLDPGETPEACAKRELEEETGCGAGALKRLTTIYTTPGFTDERIHLFLASDLSRGTARREHDEFIDTEAMPLARALELIQGGQITDGKTIVALLFAAGFVLS